MQTHNDLVFERINPKVFERCFRRWVESIVEAVGAQVIPIDGKTLKGSYDREKSYLNTNGLFQFSANTATLDLGEGCRTSRRSC